MERLTLDVGLHFWFGSMRAALPNVVIAEVKQEGFALRSDFVGQMRALGVREMRFSKYCTGLSLLCDQVKSNNFKPQWLHLVEREWGFHYTSQKSITYERIDLIKPENYQLLLADLRARTGLDITRCEIGKLDFLRDVAEIKIFYTEPQEQVVLVQSAPDTPDYSGLFGQDLQVAPGGQQSKKHQP